MVNREKIESLKQCLSASCRGFRTCPYNDTEWDAIETVLELLAEQEPVEPHAERDCDDGVWYYGCGACHGAIDYKDKFCRHCGREVKWDERSCGLQKAGQKPLA